MKKNQIIALVIVVVLIFGGIIGWALLQKGKMPLEKGVIFEEEEAKEVFSMLAVVSSVDAENNFLVVKPTEEEKEIKVVLSEATKLIKFELPFDPKNPPKEAERALEQTEIEISDFEVGDTVLIKAKENIAGKSEFDKVDFIHILP
jgi:hypothetical protein